MFDAESKSRSANGLVAERGAVLPVEAMVLGKTLREAAELVPRLFNLCRAAQAQAMHIALGLPQGPNAAVEIRREILRDHLMKFSVGWPGFFGMGPRPLPDGWAEGRASVAEAIFGAGGEPPVTADAFESYLASEVGVGPVLRRIDQTFAPGIAVSGPMPSLTPTNAFLADPVENSVAGRHALHPTMRYIAETRGFGPLWRATARALDVIACLNDRLPVPQSSEDGSVIVTAARGSYAVRASHERGRITGFARITPTDHLMVAGGILQRSLETLPVDKRPLAPLVMSILDPCSPVRVHEAGARNA